MLVVRVRGGICDASVHVREQRVCVCASMGVGCVTWVSDLVLVVVKWLQFRTALCYACPDSGTVIILCGFLCAVCLWLWLCPKDVGRQLATTASTRCGSMASSLIS